METPLIYTSKGNLPIETLKVEAFWENTDTYIKLIERYTDPTGEIVRESAHVFIKEGIAGLGETGAFA